MAGAALLIDYILTVAVSIASGVDQIASVFPVLFAYKVQMALLLVLLMTLVNLRGVKESGAFFAIPTYFFIVLMLTMIGVGFFQASPAPWARSASSPAPRRHVVSDRAGPDLPAAAGLQFRHHSPHRRRSDQQRHYGLQAAQSAATPRPPWCGMQGY